MIVSWARLVELMVEEVGRDGAARIEARARLELGGERITVRKRKVISVKEIDAVAPGKPEEAAKILGVHRSTVYRKLQRPLVR